MKYEMICYLEICAYNSHRSKIRRLSISRDTIPEIKIALYHCIEFLEKLFSVRISRMILYKRSYECRGTAKYEIVKEVKNGSIIDI